MIFKLTMSFGFQAKQVMRLVFASGSTYRIVASTSPSRFEAHAGFFRFLMKGIFDPYVPFGIVHKLRLQDEVGRWLSKCQQG